jgi:Flp pilus assembly protein TadB
MENETAEVKTIVARTPAEMLARQVELLEGIRDTLDNQQQAIVQLAKQQQTQAKELAEVSKRVDSIGDALFPEDERHPGRQSVKVQDFNMPFFNLAGFMVKVALASIPAAIIIGILWLLAAAFLGILF